MKTTKRTPSNGKAAGTSKQAATKSDNIYPDSVRTALQNTAIQFGRMNPAELFAAADDLENNAAELRTAAKAVRKDSQAWDRAGAEGLAPAAFAPVPAGATLAPSYRAMPPLIRENVATGSPLDMETALQRGLALMELFARLDCTLTERRKPSYSGNLGCGMMTWASDLNAALHHHFYAANEANRGGGDNIPAIRKLGNTIEKFQSLLLMLAHDLSSSEYSASDKLGFELPEHDIAPHLSLAADCIEYLRASFYDNLGRHLPMDEFDLAMNEELLAKFRESQSVQDRRAA